MEHQCGGQQRYRNRHQGDHGGADIEKKQEQHHRHQDRAVAQCLLDIGHRMLDEVGLLEKKGRRFNALWQILAEFYNGFLDLSGKGDAVGGRLLLHRQDYGGLTLIAAIATLDGRCQLHIGKLLKQDGLPILYRHHKVLQIFDARAAADMANQVFAALRFEKPATGIRAEIAQRGFQFFALDAQCLKLGRTQFDPILPHFAADRNHLGNAGNGQEARSQYPVRIFTDQHRTDQCRIGWDGNE